MKTYEIAVYPGDGIGPEVIDQAVRVLEAVQSNVGGFRLRMTRLPWGADYWVDTGRAAPAGFLDILRPVDAILLGALGDPQRIPDHITLEPLIRIRQSFDQYACVRPARLSPGVASPLAVEGASQVDLVVIRENSEGEYVNNGGRFKVGTPGEFALQTAIHTRHGIERILRFGFELALTRRQHLTMITKSNAQRYGFVLWDEILNEMREQYPAVRVDKQHVDAAAMNFVRNPAYFDVVVGSNLFGDILSDLGGIIGGGLGLAPSANINPEREYPSMFEPVHGSAPDIAGQGIANPIAAILSAAMMLDWLGLEVAAASVWRAVEAALSQGAGTPDLGGRLNTHQMADAVIQNLDAESLGDKV
jgi:tartrate dehydrogenase/decarboxylase/D-malate dehydrogenase